MTDDKAECLNWACTQVYGTARGVAEATGEDLMSILVSVTLTTCASAGAIPWLIDCANRAMAGSDDRGQLQIARSPGVDLRVIQASKQLLDEASDLAAEIGNGITPLDLLASLTVAVAARSNHLNELIACANRAQAGRDDRSALQ